MNSDNPLPICEECGWALNSDGACLCETTRPIPRCFDCKSALADTGRCESCDDRALTPQPDDTLLDAAWRAYKTGRGTDPVTWADVQAIQRQLMPRCAAHGVNTALEHNGNPICPQCIEEEMAMQVAA